MHSILAGRSGGKDRVNHRERLFHFITQSSYTVRRVELELLERSGLEREVDLGVFFEWKLSRKAVKQWVFWVHALARSVLQFTVFGGWLSSKIDSTVLRQSESLHIVFLLSSTLHLYLTSLRSSLTLLPVFLSLSPVSAKVREKENRLKSPPHQQEFKGYLVCALHHSGCFNHVIWVTEVRLKRLIFMWQLLRVGTVYLERSCILNMEEMVRMGTAWKLIMKHSSICSWDNMNMFSIIFFLTRGSVVFHFFSHLCKQNPYHWTCVSLYIWLL